VHPKGADGAYQRKKFGKGTSGTYTKKKRKPFEGVRWKRKEKEKTSERIRKQEIPKFGSQNFQSTVWGSDGTSLRDKRRKIQKKILAGPENKPKKKKPCPEKKSHSPPLSLRKRKPNPSFK